MDVIEDRGDTFDLVQQGMMGVAQTIPALASYPYTIACKTGSPQRSESYYAGSTRKHYTNATMIAYGPVEDPRIAIGIVVEYGGAGARTGQLVADIFDAYFAMQNGTLTVDDTVSDAPARPGTVARCRSDRRLWTATPTADETDTAGETAPAAGNTDGRTLRDAANAKGEGLIIRGFQGKLENIQKKPAEIAQKPVVK